MARKIPIVAGILAGLLLISCGIHWAFLYVRETDLPMKYLALGYGGNFLMALAIFWAMLYLAIRKNRYLGFYFLLGSGLKFVVYFLIFEPLFLSDGRVQQVEFFTFFVPYIIALQIETYQVIQLLKSVDG